MRPLRRSRSAAAATVVEAADFMVAVAAGSTGAAVAVRFTGAAGVSAAGAHGAEATAVVTVGIEEAAIAEVPTRVRRWVAADTDTGGPADTLVRMGGATAHEDTGTEPAVTGRVG